MASCLPKCANRKAVGVKVVPDDTLQIYQGKGGVDLLGKSLLKSSPALRPMGD